MRIEEPIFDRLNEHDEANGGATPEQETEAVQFQMLARQLEQLEPVRLRPQVRGRIAARLAQRAAAERSGAAADEGTEDVLKGQEARLFRQLANRLGVSIDDLRRYIGPRFAVMVGRFLGVPGYSAMFDLLGFLLRTLRRIESTGSIH